MRSYYNPLAKFEFGEITACILYVRSDIGHIYIYIARLMIEHHREWLASLADYKLSSEALVFWNKVSLILCMYIM